MQIPPLSNNSTGQHNVCFLTAVSVRKVTKRVLNVSAGRVQQRHYGKYPQSGNGPMSCIWGWRLHNEVFLSMAGTNETRPYHREKSIRGIFTENFQIAFFFFTKYFFYSWLLLKGCIKVRLSRKSGFHHFSLSILERISVPKQYILFLIIDLLSHFLLASSG